MGGGYRLRPGYRLPPLMLSDDEAVAVVLGLVAARRLGLDAGGEHPDGALEKIHRVLPATLRRRVEALETTLGVHRGGDRRARRSPARPLLELADAIRRRHRLRTSYTSFSGERSRRELSPYGLVVHAGRWYLAAHDHGREAMRTFRVDRMRRTSMTRDTWKPPAGGFDAVAHVARSLASVPWTWEVEVLLDLPLADLAARIPSTLAELVDRRGADRAAHARRLARLDGRRFSPASAATSSSSGRMELRESVRGLAKRLAAQVS